MIHAKRNFALGTSLETIETHNDRDYDDPPTVTSSAQ